MNSSEFAKFKSHIDKLAQECYQRAKEMPDDNIGRTANNWYGYGMKRAYREIEALGLVSEDSDWVNVNNGLPNDDDICHIILKDGAVVYGVYSDEHKGFARADNLTVKNGKYILDVYCDIYPDEMTHWRKLPQPPQE